MRLFCVILFLMFSIVMFSTADFHPTDKPTLGISSSGFGSFQSHAIQGELPIPAIDGYWGVRYMLSRNDGRLLGDELISRIEGGHTFSWLSVRGYLRYGRGIASLYEDNAFHGGGYLEASLYSRKDWDASAGLGTWAEKSVLGEYGETLTPDDTGFTFGPRGHLTVSHKRFKVTGVVYFANELLWNTKVIPSWRLGLPFGFEFVLSGEIVYFPKKPDSFRLHWISAFHKTL